MLLVVAGLLLSHHMQAKNEMTKRTQLQSDSLQVDTLQAVLTGVVDTLSLQSFKPDPLKVVWMGAIIPGYGQILNRKYWKLPVVYGGFLGCAYFISRNSSLYQTYKSAYRDIIDSDPNTKSYEETVPPGYTIGQIGMSAYTESLKTQQDYYRRYRDLSIILSAGFYAITIIDAYVDAQLYDFDISPDLSLKLQPVLIKNNYNSIGTLGVKCKLLLK